MERAFAAVARHRLRLPTWLLRFLDVLIAPFILEQEALLLYLAARLASLIIPASLWWPARRVAPALNALALPEPGAAFQSAAARVNLGFMMIAAAASIAVLWVAPFLAGRVDAPAAWLSDILLWLVLGQCATVLFGATRLMMQAVGRGTFMTLLEGIAAGCFVTALFIGKGSDPVFLAQAVAAAQLTQAGLSALLLTQCGVWPGLSALLQTRIRLR